MASSLNNSPLRSSRASRSFPNLPQLPVISENNDWPGPIEPNTQPRRLEASPFTRHSNISLTHLEHDVPPPAYTPFLSQAWTNAEKRPDLRSNEFISRRGGWKRLGVIAIIVIALIVGLVVGLVIGLRRKHPKDSSTTTPPATTSSSTVFPAGSFTLTTFLESANTNCTSNPATWRCYPYATFAQDPSSSTSIFNWVITPLPSHPQNFTISSTANPFALEFDNVTLTLLDADLPTERYYFALPMDKTIIPSAPLTSDNAQSVCFYNATTFQASLYTKKGQTYPSSGQASLASSGSQTTTPFEPWPFAVEVEQVVNGGQNVPMCRESVNGNLGDRITNGLSPQSANSQCSCFYQNWGQGS
ncbi:hypothetical protein L228DRAFT_239073 [Xylona heveae TC161]|uniref:Tat pathway signal sequence n=1 Tax=Xylona heveae (strain CBS 132557 / TC161) TaxID=1328760 RepID=A0A165GD90_XYLHT|nr:hypothetical protein L228DRAFT_239073 [Xylona heveae TC161]KZF22051.1 hypothetical protein L228DRAFT_239073 [Xylona heveae TC161]